MNIEELLKKKDGIGDPKNREAYNTLRHSVQPVTLRITRLFERYFPKINNLSVINYDDNKYLKKIIATYD